MGVVGVDVGEAPWTSNGESVLLKFDWFLISWIWSGCGCGVPCWDGSFDRSRVFEKSYPGLVRMPPTGLVLLVDTPPAPPLLYDEWRGPTQAYIRI